MLIQGHVNLVDIVDAAWEGVIVERGAVGVFFSAVGEPVSCYGVTFVGEGG